MEITMLSVNVYIAGFVHATVACVTFVRMKRLVLGQIACNRPKVLYYLHNIIIQK